MRKEVMLSTDQSQKTYFSILFAEGQHNYKADVLLPDHSPEVVDCVNQRALACNIFLFLVIALQVVEKQNKEDDWSSLALYLNFK